MRTILTVLLLAIPGLGLAEPAPDSATTLAVEVLEPDHGKVVLSGPPWIELRGWAGSEGLSGHDVVVVVDLSGSTADASGVDVDGDGEVGRGSRRRNRFNSSDPEDTVLAAELLAILRLSEQIDRGRNRLGIVSFAGRPRIEAALGTPRPELELALANLQGAFAGGGTDLAQAIRKAGRMLVEGREEQNLPRLSSILILSDGVPTEPSPVARAARAAISAAGEAAAEGIRVHAYALYVPPKKNEGRDDVYATIAQIGGGQRVRVEKPGEVIHELPRIRLGRTVDVQIASQQTGEAAAVRTFPDGSFDGVVRLVEGENRITVAVQSEDGAQAETTLQVVFAPRPPRDAAEAEAFRLHDNELLERLRDRTIETELSWRARQKKDTERELDVELEP